MPQKSLFDDSHRPEKMEMPGCDDCNRGTSTADLTAAIVSRWNYDSDDKELKDHSRLVARMRKQAPDLVKEWTKLGPAERAMARLHLIRHGVPVPADASTVTLGPLTICQLNLFAHKAVLGLYFESFRRPLPNTGCVWATWKIKEDFAVKGIPQFVLDMLPRYGALIQGRWDTRRTFEYKYEFNISDGRFGCLARFRGALFVMGFAFSDRNQLPNGQQDWITPSELLKQLDSPRFQQKQ
jgi:hypothetical protein